MGGQVWGSVDWYNGLNRGRMGRGVADKYNDRKDWVRGQRRGERESKLVF